MKQIIIVKDNDHLKKLIEKEISIHGKNCNLNHFDVSKVIDMSGLFFDSEFNGNISKWNISNVINMHSMFYNSKFNGDISNWDVSDLIYAEYMFHDSKFNKDLTQWKPYKLKDKFYMFENCPASLPYWYSAENAQKAIELYEFKEKLNDYLDDKLNNKIKIKI